MAHLTHFLVPCSMVFVLGLTGCSNRQEQAHEKLHARQADFTVDEFIKAAGEGDAEKVKSFIEAGMDKDAADEVGETALLQAARHGHGHIISYLLGLGAQVNHCAADGENPLTAAARTGDADSVGALLKCGADTEKHDGRGLTALGEAALAGNAPAVRALAPQSRPSLNYALQIAAVKGQVDVVEALLAAGADPHSRSLEHKTPLMYAATHGRMDAVRLLLDHHSNPLDLDRSGKSASMLAQENGYDEIANLLLQPPAAEDVLAGAEMEKVSEETPLASPPEYAPGDAPALDPGEAQVTANPDGQVIDASAVASHEIPSDFRQDNSFSGEPVKAAKITMLTEASDTSAPRPGDAEAAEVCPLAGAYFRPLPQPGLEQVQKAFRLRDYRQRQLPIVVRSVSGKKATVQMLSETTQEVEVAKGDILTDLKLEVLSIRRQIIPSKLGRGQAADVSEVILRDTRTGEQFLARLNEPVMSSATMAILKTASHGQLLEVHNGDEFQIGTEQYKVTDIRPTQVVLESVATGETAVITR